MIIKEKSGRVVLRERDIELLKCLFACRFLSTSQIKNVFFGKNHSVVCQRLNKKLLPNGLVERYYKKISFNSLEAIYSIGPVGAQILADKLNIERSEIYKRKETSRPMFLLHTLETNDVWAALIVACRNSLKSTTLASWWTERKLKRLYPGRRDIPIADSRFTLQMQDSQKLHFFLEVDRDTERAHDFAENKVRKYLAYFLSGKQQEDFGFRLFRVLTVVPDKKRCEDLMKESMAAGANNMFLFSLRENMTPEKILKPIWVTPRDWYYTSEPHYEKRYAIID